MIGFFIIEGFTGAKDSAGFDTVIKVASKMDMNIKCELFLPPYMRKVSSDIGTGDTVFGIVDDITGIGAALFGEGAADFKYYYDADINIKQKLTVDKSTTLKDTLDVTKAVTANDTITATKNIKSSTGDVIATTISLKTHTHPATLTANVTGTATPAGLVEASGPATGSTSAPT